MEIGVLCERVVDVGDIRQCANSLLVVSCLEIGIAQLVNILAGVVVGFALVGFQIRQRLVVELFVVECFTHNARHFGLTLCIALLKQ